MSYPAYFTSLGALLITLAIAVLTPNSSHAFFFFAWPGEFHTQTRSLIPPEEDPLGNPPSARLQQSEVPPDEQRPTETAPIPPVPEVPEPGTVVIAGIGVFFLVVVRLCQRQPGDSRDVAID